MKTFLIGVFSLIVHCAIAQDEFEFGKIRLSELTISTYGPDTSAAAVILREYGYSAIENMVEGIVLVHRYHVKIKILTAKGLEHANVSVPLFKKGEQREKFISARASSFNIDEGYIKETQLIPKEIYLETIDKNWEQKKFAIPGVRVGSVIEYEYEVHTPYFYNFKPWEFQSEIPKISSEYIAIIPANFRYNISLRGLLTLKKNESEVLKDRFSAAGGKADCVKYIWSMQNIPAFYEEEYMTSKRNFLSSINFELLQIEYFDGRKDKITKEWKDVEHELKTADNFGVQLRRGKDIVDDAIEAVIAQELDPRVKAEKIFTFIRNWYDFNDNFSKYTETGIKKAFDSRKGNVGDINLSLIAALRYAGLNVEPMILSTRENGLPVELYPVLSEFNYVVAKLNIGDKVYLLDATDDFLPFGLLPQRCLNGKGRVLGEKESYWYEIKPNERSRQVSTVSLVLGTDGSLNGTIKITYSGYRAAQKRSSVYSHPTVDDYIKEKKNSTTEFEVLNCAFENLEDLSKPLIETMTIALEDFPLETARSFFFNPYLGGRWEKNPFHLTERLFPVDFAVPIDETLLFSMEYPADMKVTDIPEKAAFALPNNGGKFLYQGQVNGQKLFLNSSLIISNPIYYAPEYPALKEFFNRVVKVQSSDLVIEKI
jgi:transglutaminase-like putative cysteine protease